MIADNPSHMSASWHNDAVQKRGESIPSLNLAPFGRWTLRDEAAQRRLAPRWRLDLFDALRPNFACVPPGPE